MQHALKGLEKAFKGFFAKRAGFPRFKKKGSGDSFRYPEPKQIKLDQSNNRILLPKLAEAFGTAAADVEIQKIEALGPRAEAIFSRICNIGGNVKGSSTAPTLNL